MTCCKRYAWFTISNAAEIDKRQQRLVGAHLGVARVVLRVGPGWRFISLGTVMWSRSPDDHRSAGLNGLCVRWRLEELRIRVIPSSWYSGLGRCVHPSFGLENRNIGCDSYRHRWQIIDLSTHVTQVLSTRLDLCASIG